MHETIFLLILIPGYYHKNDSSNDRFVDKQIPGLMISTPKILRANCYKINV